MRKLKGATYAVVAIVIVGMLMLHRYNINKRLVKGGCDARPGEYSESGDYVNISPMKHDIFKQLTLDIPLIGLVFLFVEVLGNVESFFDASDFLSFRNFRDFRLSIIGGSIISVVGYIGKSLTSDIRRFRIRFAGYKH